MNNKRQGDADDRPAAVEECAQHQGQAQEEEMAEEDHAHGSQEPRQIPWCA